MKNFFKNQRGMSIVEVLVVISVIGILTAVVLPQFSKVKENQVLKNAVSEITSALHNAQSQSLASKDFSEYGVYFESDKILVFKGKIFNVEAVDNSSISIVLPATISNVAFNGISATTGEIYFQRLSGAPSKVGTITVSTPSYSKLITISATGTVSVN
jgi:prepilin-type N-terminal cleavage/methylation domain-containing protein